MVYVIVIALATVSGGELRAVVAEPKPFHKTLHLCTEALARLDRPVKSRNPRCVAISKERLEAM